MRREAALPACPLGQSSGILVYLTSVPALDQVQFAALLFLFFSSSCALLKTLHKKCYIGWQRGTCVPAHCSITTETSRESAQKENIGARISIRAY